MLRLLFTDPRALDASRRAAQVTRQLAARTALALLRHLAPEDAYAA